MIKMEFEAVKKFVSYPELRRDSRISMTDADVFAAIKNFAFKKIGFDVPTLTKEVGINADKTLTAQQGFAASHYNKRTGHLSSRWFRQMGKISVPVTELDVQAGMVVEDFDSGDEAFSRATRHILNDMPFTTGRRVADRTAAAVIGLAGTRAKHRAALKEIRRDKLLVSKILGMMEFGLRSLPYRQRQAVQLKHINGQTWSAIAAELGTRETKAHQMCRDGTRKVAERSGITMIDFVKIKNLLEE